MTIDVFTPKRRLNVVLDATLLSSLMSCARYYDIRFNHRMVSARGKSNSLETGAMMHKILEVFYQHQIDGFPRGVCIGNALTAGQMYVDGCPHCSQVVDVEPGTKLACGHEAGEYPGLMSTPEFNESHKTGWKYVLQTAQEYFDYYKNDSFIPLAVEEVLKKELYVDDEIRVQWKAKLDLRNDNMQLGIISMDHKTMKQRREKSNLSNQFIGHCHLLGSRNVIVNKIGFQTSLKIEDRFSRETISYGSDLLEEWRSEILPYYAYKYVQYNESGYWPPNFTHCDNIYGSCAYKPVCESDREMRERVIRAEFIKAPIWDPQNKEEE